MKTVELVYEDYEQLCIVDVINWNIDSNFFMIITHNREQLGYTTKGLVSYRVYESDKEVE